MSFLAIVIWALFENCGFFLYTAIYSASFGLYIYAKTSDILNLNTND